MIIYTKIEGDYYSEDDIKILVTETKEVKTENVLTLLELRKQERELADKIVENPEKLIETKAQKSDLSEFLADVDTTLNAK